MEGKRAPLCCQPIEKLLTRGCTRSRNNGKGEMKDEQLDGYFGGIGCLCIACVVTGHRTGGAPGTTCARRRGNGPVCFGGGEFDGIFYRGIGAAQPIGDRCIRRCRNTRCDLTPPAEFDFCVRSPEIYFLLDKNNKQRKYTITCKKALAKKGMRTSPFGYGCKKVILCDEAHRVCGGLLCF